MATILLTGASGQLGNEIKVASGNYYGYDFIFTDTDTLDITDEVKVREFIARVRPDWIINCAAYNLVDRVETECDRALMVNGTSVRYITEAIRESDCRFFHISTDYVFDGKSNVPYNENSWPDPLSAYGRSKLEGEKHALLYHSSMVIRTSWLYSSFGNNFVKTILRHAAEKESLRVVFDQTGTPTYAADLAETILHIISGVIRNRIAFNTGVYHYSNEGVCSWYDFASEIVRESGLKCRIEPILSKDYPSPAPRPHYAVLDKAKIKENYDIIIPHWRTSLEKCMSIIQKS
ncbi:MAG: dTDP-4-dehydrorhamnose reductase [Bacteroidales bacterium]